MTSLLVLSLLGSGIQAPAPMAPRDQWIGLQVCTKSPATQAHERKANGSFEAISMPFKYMAFRVVDDAGEFVLVQQNDTVFWLNKAEVLRPKEAIPYFSAQLEENPKDFRAAYSRSWAYLTINDFDRALKDIEVAEQISPGNPAPGINRGILLIKQKKFEDALRLFDAMLAKNPGYFYALYNRAEVHLQLKHFDKAIEDARKALEIEPQVPGLLIILARAQATASDPKLRDGRQALSSARKAVESLRYRDGRFLDTLACAYAETGDFERAVQTQQKVVDDPDYMREEGDKVRARLKLYREGKPYREE